MFLLLKILIKIFVTEFLMTFLFIFDVIILFQIDSDYIGAPPPLEVTVFNINDNIDKQFLFNEIVSILLF